MRSGFVVLPALLSIHVLLAQQTPISGPVEGFTFDLPTMSLRPVTGSLGSASLGKPMVERISYGSVAPQQNYALTFQDEHCALVLGLGSAQTSTIRVPGSFITPEGVAWSGDGSIAILYSRTGNWIQILSGLPSAVNPGASLSIAPLGGTLSAVAIDSHGERIAIGVVGETAGVFQVANSGNFVPLLSFSKPIALGFSDDAGTLYGVDAATNQLFALTMANLTSQSWPLNGPADPVAIKPTHDATNRAVIYIAGRSDRVLEVVDPSTQQILASVQLNFEPSVIQPLGIDSFVLAPRATSDDVFWSFRNTAQPTVYFVPAPAVPSRESTRK
jgi:hypothetical protein